jgi:hypothetical protein
MHAGRGVTDALSHVVNGCGEAGGEIWHSTGGGA